MNSSNSSTGDLGNTKTKSQSSPKITWCFTLHNYLEKDIILLVDYFNSSNSSYIFSTELGGSNSTPHLQGWFRLKTKQRFTALVLSFSFLSNKIHLEGAKGNQNQNIIYITKESEKEGYNLYENVLPEKIYSEPVNKKLRFLLTKMDNYPRPQGDRLIHCIVDQVGGLGKTEFARHCVLNYADCIITGGKAQDMKNQIIEYKKTNNCFPKIVIIDIPRSNLDYVSYAGIEEVKNMLFYSGKYEGGMVCGNKPFVLMLMNERPKKEKLSKDRWRVYYVDNDEIENSQDEVA